MQRISALLSVVVFGCFTSNARSDEPGRPLDDNFLIKISSCVHAEIELDKLADKRASSPKVKEFAADLVKDHQKCFENLAQATKYRKISVVTGFEKDAQAEMDRLSKLEGAHFDREFIACVIKSHKDGIAMFEAQANDGKNAEIRKFANDTLPTLREHLKRALEVSKTVNP